MGLDIYHNKLLKNRPEKIGYSNDGIYLENGFQEFKKEDWQIIEPFVKEVEYYNCVKSIFFSANPKDIDFLTRELNDVEILTGKNQTDLENEIKSFESKQKLTHLFKTVNDSAPPWNIIKYYEKEIRMGFYTEEVGYQRKGMINKFWEHFDYESEYHYYFNKKDFLNAYECVGHYWDSDSNEDIQKRKQIFKNNFVDNFEFGISFLELSF